MNNRASASAATVVRAVRSGRREPLDSRPPLRLAGAFALYAALLLALLPFSGRAFLAVSDVAGIVPPLLAGALSSVAAGRSSGHVRLGWRLIGAGCLSWGAGEIIWTVYEVGLRDDPFPSAADAGYLTMLPLTALGLIHLTSEERRLAHSRPTLDGFASVLAVTAFVWFFVLHPTYAESAASVFEKAIGAAYPVGDLVLAYALAVAVQRRWGDRDSIVLTALLLGMMSLVAADVGFAYLTLRDAYTSTSLVNLGWPYGFLLIAYAAALGASWTLTYEVGEGHATSGAWRQAVLLLLLPPLVGLDLVAFRDKSLAVSIPLSVMVGLVALAVLARLAINLGLLRELEQSRQRLVVWIEAHRRRAAA